MIVMHYIWWAWWYVQCFIFGFLFNTNTIYDKIIFLTSMAVTLFFILYTKE